MEGLVPELELCRQIPEGAFEDSVMVITQDGCVEIRKGSMLKYRPEIKKYPAPTLEEILIAQPRIVLIFQYDYDYDTSIWRGIWRAGVFDSQQGPISKYDCKPVNAALKLWLELNTI